MSQSILAGREEEISSTYGIGMVGKRLPKWKQRKLAPLTVYRNINRPDPVFLGTGKVGYQKTKSQFTNRIKEIQTTVFPKVYPNVVKDNDDSDSEKEYLITKDHQQYLDDFINEKPDESNPSNNQPFPLKSDIVKDKVLSKLDTIDTTINYVESETDPSIPIDFSDKKEFI